MLGFLLIFAGSVSTGFFLIAATYVLFLNPAISLRQLISESSRLIQITPALWVLLLYLSWLTISALIAERPSLGISFVVSQWQLFIAIPFAIGFYRLTPDINFACLFSYGIRIAIPVVLLVVLYQLIALGIRPKGPSGNELILSTLCSIGAVLAFSRWDEDKRSHRIFATFSFACGLLIVLVTFSRSSWILMLLLAVCTAFYSRSRFKDFSIGKRGFLAFAILSVPLVLYVLQSAGFQRMLNLRIFTPIERLIEGKLPSESIGERLGMLQGGIEMLNHAPFVGYGIQNTVLVVNAFFEERNSEFIFQYTHLHNDYLNHAVAGGYMLAVLFAITVWLPFLLSLRIGSSFKNRGTIAFIAFCTSFGFAFSALTNIALRNDLLATLFSAVLISVLVVIQQERDSLLHPIVPDFGSDKNNENDA